MILANILIGVLWLVAIPVVSRQLLKHLGFGESIRQLVTVLGVFGGGISAVWLTSMYDVSLSVLGLWIVVGVFVSLSHVAASMTFKRIVQLPFVFLPAGALFLSANSLTGMFVGSGAVFLFGGAAHALVRHKIRTSAAAWAHVAGAHGLKTVSPKSASRRFEGQIRSLDVVLYPTLTGPTGRIQVRLPVVGVGLTTRPIASERFQHQINATFARSRPAWGLPGLAGAGVRRLIDGFLMPRAAHSIGTGWSRHRRLTGDLEFDLQFELRGETPLVLSWFDHRTRGSLSKASAFHNLSIHQGWLRSFVPDRTLGPRELKAKVLTLAKLAVVFSRDSDLGTSERLLRNLRVDTSAGHRFRCLKQLLEPGFPNTEALKIAEDHTDPRIRLEAISRLERWAALEAMALDDSVDVETRLMALVKLQTGDGTQTKATPRLLAQLKHSGPKTLAAAAAGYLRESELIDRGGLSLVDGDGGELSLDERGQLSLE